MGNEIAQDAAFYRQTGRSFRLLLNVLHDASLGKRVLVVCRDQYHALYLCKKAWEICCSCGLQNNEHIYFEAPNLIVHFPIGSVRFVGVQRYRSTEFDPSIYTDIEMDLS